MENIKAKPLYIRILKDKTPISDSPKATMLLKLLKHKFLMIRNESIWKKKQKTKRMKLKFWRQIEFLRMMKFLNQQVQINKLLHFMLLQVQEKLYKQKSLVLEINDETIDAELLIQI